tara:strand:+ start:11 stop:343 length:333 start_codon:yes stop_codon:yes gene_type:complete
MKLLMENWKKYLKEAQFRTDAGDTPRSVAATIEAWIEEEEIDQSVDMAEIADKIAKELHAAGVRDDYIADWEDALYNWLDLEPPEAEEGDTDNDGIPDEKELAVIDPGEI